MCPSRTLVTVAVCARLVCVNAREVSLGNLPQENNQYIKPWNGHSHLGRGGEKDQQKVSRECLCGLYLSAPETLNDCCCEKEQASVVHTQCFGSPDGDGSHLDQNDTSHHEPTEQSKPTDGTIDT